MIPAALVVGAGGFVVLGNLFFSRAAPQQALGLVNGSLAPCPAGTLNCVDTRSGVEYAAMEPLRYSGSTAEAMARIKAIVAVMPRQELVTEQDNYLHYTFRSAVFGFVDDVEFQFDDATKTIHFRSAARLGVGDIGVNRARMEEIREAFLTE